MDTLQTLPRPPRAELKPRRDPLAVFREFLDHLDRAARRKAQPRAARAVKRRRGRK